MRGDGGRGRRILVVDDDARVAALLAEGLRALGYGADTARDGLEALEMLDGRVYDGVLCDVRMPRCDGPGLYRALERTASPLLGRIVFMTGDLWSAEVKGFVEATGVRCLAKPFGLREAADALESMLGRC